MIAGLKNIGGILGAQTGNRIQNALPLCTGPAGQQVDENGAARSDLLSTKKDILSARKELRDLVFRLKNHDPAAIGIRFAESPL
jgi:hypothetical protein